jgi:hypothetical protein
MGVSGRRHAPATLYPREMDPRYPLDRKLGGPQSWSGTEVRWKILLPLLGIEPRSPGRPVHSQTLYWLSYPGSYTGLYCAKMKFFWQLLIYAFLPKSNQKYPLKNSGDEISRLTEWQINITSPKCIHFTQFVQNTQKYCKESLNMLSGHLKCLKMPNSPHY